ncbi:MULTISPECIES: aspartate-semialdehyde dehydrogenase [unclassified Gemella]|uniref:aspartate-semialdehyde dehydrogenase n=1 Tax=unclassified Gemella TaxID=2624949 RepID=UPI0015CFA8FA|nr:MULTISPECIES: aspartate-semialdehyde dehydrogenase [unclassified Gemella]MBF0710027.1 aspartate-semialdehyde dehydrogenase [Gemella sp. GL1.1]NYS27371.1 aspartate-semialdehyde dehydrogenase [Gemella sp. GL1]
MNKSRVAVLGATGMVGQRLLMLLENHPYFDVVKLAASARSAGQKYGKLMENRWKLEEKMPSYVEDLEIYDVFDIDNIASNIDMVFCALDLDKSRLIKLEEDYAKREVVVVSNNSANRMMEDIPMIIPEINVEHLDIIDFQRKRLGTKYGFIVVKPNCSIQSYVPVFNAIREYGIKEASICTYQAISGSGKNFDEWPEMIENIIPYIGGEEEKSEQEPLKIFGKIKDGKIISDSSMKLSAQCIRVPVLDGHMAAVSFNLENDPGKEVLLEKIKNYVSDIDKYDLPLTPKPFIKYYEEDNRPQPILDRDHEKGMQISVGRFREDNLFDYKFVALSHNTMRGAAGGALQTAELIKKLGYLDKK